MTRCGQEGGRDCNVTLRNTEPNDCVNNLCVPQDAGPGMHIAVTAEPPPEAQLLVDPQLSTITVHVKGKTGVGAVEGPMRIVGAACPGNSCTFSVDYMLLDARDFSLDGHAVTGSVLRSDSTFSSTVTPGGNYVVSPAGTAFFAKFSIDGTLSGLVLQPASVLAGTIDYNGGTMTMVAAGGQDDVSVELFLVARFVNRPPVARAGGARTVECTTHGGGNAHLDGSASTDPDGPGDIALYAWFEEQGLAESPLRVGQVIDAVLPLGDHLLVLAVQDRTGALSTDSFDVNVVDTEPPDVTALSISPACLWPPDHRYIRFQLGRDLVVATADACDLAPPTVRIVGAVSSEPDNGLGDGDTARDIVFDDTTVCLRAERSGAMPAARVYTVTLAISDHDGNQTMRTVTVEVPHNHGHAGNCPVLSEERRAVDDAACTALAR
jgi:hypothetical protein